MKVRLLAFLIALLPVLASCGPAEEPAPPLEPEAGAETSATPAGTRENPFVGHGVIQEIQTDERRVVIQHEEIPGFMAAMTMAFPVSEEVPIDDLEVGDQVMFNVEMVGDNQYQVFRIEEEAPAGTGAGETTP